MSVRQVAALSLFFTALLPGCPPAAIAAQNVRLTWAGSSSPDVTGYNVYYGPESGVYPAMLSVAGATTVNVEDLPGGLTYYFAVTAYNSSGLESELSNEASYSVPGLAPPGTPFIAQTLPDHAVTIGWNPSRTAGVPGYYLHYGTQSGSYDSVVWVETGTEADVHQLADGVTYFFAVTATNSSGLESALSAELAYIIPPIAPPQAAPVIQQIFPDDRVTLAWDASPSADVAGYKVYYGTQSGQYDHWMDAGAAGTADIGGLVEGLTYYFAVAAYSSAGQESGVSLEAAGYLVPVATVDTNVFLSLQPIPIDGFPNAFAVTATGLIPSAWTLEGSADLKTWRALATGVEPEVKVTVVVSEKPALFFRLNSWIEEMTLAVQAGETNRYPNSFVVATPYTVPWDWTLESSEDLQNWSPFSTGYFTPVKVAVISAATPQLFFRLKGG